MRPPQRVPLSRWKRGQVLRLKEPVCGVRDGWFAFVGQDGGKFKVCRLDENDSGELSGTDETYELQTDVAVNFALAKSTWRI